jgi:microcin C transport system substrate-binding protein
LMTWESMIKLLDERAFDMVIVAYTGDPFPNPEGQYLSTLADQKNNNNITGFKNKRADEILAAYYKEFDQSKRVKLLRELDGLVTNSHSWILEWTAPYERVVYWHKFGQPRGYLTRIGSYSLPDISLYWWIDPERAAKLETALKDSSVQLGEGPSEDKYWMEFAKAEELESQVTK